MTIQVILYTRNNCKLCHQAKTDLAGLHQEILHELVEVNVDSDPDLAAVYSERVPVIQAGPFTLESPFDQRKLRMTLGAARDNQLERIQYEGAAYEKQVQRRQTMSGSDRFTYIFSKHYLLLVIIFLLLYAGLPFLAPVFMKAGYPALARPIYSFYGATCHKLAYRSWFLFGEQPAYPREAAGIEGWLTYGEVSGNDERNLWKARDYNGELSVDGHQIGYKVPFCQRDIAIWGAMFLFSVLFTITGRKIPPLPIVVWFIVGILPMGLDGGTQLVSQTGWFPWFPYRESTPLLRTITGALFGFTTGWFGIPVLEETFEDTRRILAAKRARIASRRENQAG